MPADAASCAWRAAVSANRPSALLALLLEYGPSALQRAFPQVCFHVCRGPSSVVFLRLLARFAPALIDVPGPNGQRPLWVCLSAGAEAEALILLQAGADAHAPGPRGASALGFAAWAGLEAVVDQLTYRLDPDGAWARDPSLLRRALQSRRFGVFHRLLEAGACWDGADAALALEAEAVPLGVPGVGNALRREASSRHARQMDAALAPPQVVRARQRL